MTTSKANELAREALIKIIVAQMRTAVRRRCDKGLSPVGMWREVHRRSQ
jgi:hypothetical protein